MNETNNIKRVAAVVLVGIVGVVVLLFSFSHAFTTDAESRGSLNIVTGNLFALIDSDELNEHNQIIIEAGKTVDVSLDLINVNEMDAKFNLFYSSPNSLNNIEIGYLQTGDEAPDEYGVALMSHNKVKDRKEMKVRIRNKESSAVRIDFGSTVGFIEKDLTFPEGKQKILPWEWNNLRGAHQGSFYDYREQISKVIFETSVNIPRNAVEVWDVSNNQDETVQAFIVRDPSSTEFYHLYIQADGKINAPVNSRQLFNEFINITEYVGLNNLDTSNVTNMSSMFRANYALTGLDLSSFDTSKVTTMESMFSRLISLEHLDISNFNTSNVRNMATMFFNETANNKSTMRELDLSHFDTRNVTTMERMFFAANHLTNLNLNSFDTRNVTNMSFMFWSTSSLTNLNLSSFDTRNVTNMHSMFNEMWSLENLDISNFDTRNVTDMSFMFRNNRSLTELNISHFDTSKVTTMESMFARMISLNHLDISNFNTSNVTTMRAMFYNERDNNRSTMRVLNLSHFDTRNVVDMDLMFYDANQLTHIDLSNFDTRNVTTKLSMFRNTTNLDQVLVNRDTWKTTGVDTTGMWSGSKINAVTFK